MRLAVGVFALSSLLVLGAAFLASGSARASAAREWDVAAWRWLRVSVAASAQQDGLLAVASFAGDPAAGSPARVAVGHERGVSVRVGDAPFEFAARVAGVRDLAFAPDGSLWIASLGGLWHLAIDGELADRSPAPGELARAAHRVVVGAERLVVGTEAGAWSSRDGRRWRRLADGLPMGPVTALALRERRVASGADESGELWLVVADEVWRFDLESDKAYEVRISDAPAGTAPTDLAVELPGIEAAVLYPRSLAVLAAGLDTFQVVHPVWPPGAVARRLVAGVERLWLATDLGLLSAPGYAGPWRRAESPAGSAAIRSVALTGAGDGVLAASGLGLLRGSPVLRAGGSPASPGLASGAASTPFEARRDPDIRAVHRASLRYLALGPERMRELREGLQVRGWIPSVSVRIDADRDVGWQNDSDESFVSGETRHLTDRGKDRSLDLGASLVMTWDLPSLAFDPDAIDISREHRLIVSLRDNVLDEINQLYFERVGLLEKLAAPGDTPDLDRRAMQRRADELSAGLDAWTGGWFSRPEAHPPLGPEPDRED